MGRALSAARNAQAPHRNGTPGTAGSVRATGDGKGSRGGRGDRVSMSRMIDSEIGAAGKNNEASPD